MDHALPTSLSQEDPAPQQGRIAVIEDGAETRYFLTQALRGQGYHVKAIEDGSGALPLLRLHMPDVILLDVNMPGLSGLDVCRQIRADPLLRNVIVILLTARASGDDRAEGWRAGADDYLIKPAELPEVLARVSAHLRDRETPHRRWRNPVTGLAAPAALEDELRSRVRRGMAFGLCYADIAFFKGYNHRYGYVAGDQLLVATAEALREIAGDLNARAESTGAVAQAVAGHLGSDDFLLITAPGEETDAATRLSGRFAVFAPSLYREVDRDRGWIPVVGRDGETRNVPLVRLMVATAQKLAEDFAGPVPDSIVALLWQELIGQTTTQSPPDAAI
jgi:CheY-like chemotaxis protein